MTEKVTINGRVYFKSKGVWFETGWIKAPQVLTVKLDQKLASQRINIEQAERRLVYPEDVLQEAITSGSGGAFSVYVIELSEEARQEWHQDGPIDHSKPCVYVGQTSLSPPQRFKNHLEGHNASWYVQRYGVRLRPDIYEQFNQLRTRELALRVEAALAEKLRLAGYAVFGGH